MSQRYWKGLGNDGEDFVMTAFAGLSFAPVLPSWILILLATLAGLAIGLALFRHARGTFLRGLFFLLALFALLNPSLIEEQRQLIPDVAVAIIDDSPSMSVGERRKRAEAAEAMLRDRLSRMPNLELRIVHAGGPSSDDQALIDDGTQLFSALDKALFDTPRERIAGLFLVTDGQVHDVPAADVAARFGGPLHVLLSGEHGERDRRLVVEQAPSYGIVGQSQNLTIRVEEAEANGQAITLMIRIDNGDPIRIPITIGTSKTIPFQLTHAGATIIELEAEAAPKELTLLNNRAAIVINGVRDRLRVLLVSGEPHVGERVWRNLLKADAAVDLVHFTILRPPEKQDGTPIRELSLIAFPIRELFEQKLDEFQLVIFDRYQRPGVLPNAYFQNIAQYVAKGGALLDASGPSFATPYSLARTPLSNVLPGKPTGATIVEGFKPDITKLGERHPVSAELPGWSPQAPQWGRWFRQVEVQAQGGQTIMSGWNERPLLVLDRIGEGRVAQILSDHAWLWARGFEGGGPHAELLRRVAHWLMKEPELEEDDLSGHLKGNRLEITRRSLEPDQRPVTVTTPRGEANTIPLKDAGGGRATASLKVGEPGIYRLTDSKRNAVAAVGAINPREFADMRTTDALLNPAVTAAKGGIRWLVDGMPDIRRVAPSRDTAGRGWLGLIAHEEYAVTDVRQIPLLPALLAMIGLLGTLVWAWRREGH